MNTKYLLCILFISFVFSGCAVYSDSMRADNDAIFLYECEAYGPDRTDKELRECADKYHNNAQRNAELMDDAENSNFWRNVRAGLAGGLLGGLQAGANSAGAAADVYSGMSSNARQPSRSTFCTTQTIGTTTFQNCH